MRQRCEISAQDVVGAQGHIEGCGERDGPGCGVHDAGATHGCRFSGTDMPAVVVVHHEFDTGPVAIHQAYNIRQAKGRFGHRNRP